MVRRRETDWTKVGISAETGSCSSPTEEWDCHSLVLLRVTGGNAGDTSKNTTIIGSVEEAERKQRSYSKYLAMQRE